MCKFLCCRFCIILQDFFSLSPSFTSAMKSFVEKSPEGRIEEVRKLAENSFYGAVIQFTVKKRFLCLHPAGSPIVVPNYCNFFRIANCEKVLHTKSCHQDRTKVTSSFVILVVRYPDPDPFFFSQLYCSTVCISLKKVQLAFLLHCKSCEKVTVKISMG